ncbi:hypothetical protein [Cohnella panacarvi]|uniref:hypothetical protein n=1 Tax=Cohnella panacarvi TaxID=400776 RepID=UPI00047B8B2E|nr:hypothetical protein [Cohnella panacarvi]
MSTVRILRSIAAGLILAILVIGLLPFLLVFFMADASGLADMADTTPIYTLVNKFIDWGKAGR